MTVFSDIRWPWAANGRPRGPNDFTWWTWTGLSRKGPRHFEVVEKIVGRSGHPGAGREAAFGTWRRWSGICSGGLPDYSGHQRPGKTGNGEPRPVGVSRAHHHRDRCPGQSGGRGRLDRDYRQRPAWTLGRRFEGWGVKAIIFTDIRRDGTQPGARRSVPPSVWPGPCPYRSSPPEGSPPWRTCKDGPPGKGRGGGGD